jgi:membrane-bound lytic murein transglycosylase MltF
MLKTLLLTLAMALSGGGAKGKAMIAADEVVQIVDNVDATELYPHLKNDPEEAKARLARLLISWSYWESTWDHTALGDGGRSCGIMQVNPQTIGMSCSELRRSPRAGLQAGFRVIRRLNQLCGGLKPALGAYGSGKCGGIKSIVEKRCKISEGC